MALAAATFRLALPQEIADRRCHAVRLTHECQVPAASQADQTAVANLFLQHPQAALRDDNVAVSRKDERRHANATESLFHVKVLDEAEAMGHDPLVRLPTLPGHEFEKSPPGLAMSEQQVEELIHKRIVRRQRIPREHRPRHAL
jgi:hypothetical protein